METSRRRIYALCVVCGAPIYTADGSRYCTEHLRFRCVHAIATHNVQVWQDREVEFNELSSAEILLNAAMSIRILTPDGNVDKERTERERGLWLTRKLDAIRLKAITAVFDEESSDGGSAD